MNEKKKRNMGIISFLPLTVFIVTFIYQYSRIGRFLIIGDDHAAITEILGSYNYLVWMYEFAIALTIIILLYFVIHIAKIKVMNDATRLLWIVFLAALMPLSFPIFWFMYIRNEPQNLETKADIT